MRRNSHESYNGIQRLYRQCGVFEEDALFYGKVMGIRAMISYEGENAKDLIADFHTAVDDYLEMCAAEGIEPEKAYKGSFNIRISPELHKQAVISAMARNMTLNSFVESSIKRAIANPI